jgi:pyruvate dehydrogenase E2 component (dihydrolipoamide acetyltransferase)
VDLGNVDGTGPSGRITKDDVLEYVESLNLRSSQKPDTSLRNAVARAMIAAKSSVPHFYAETDIIVDGLLEEKRRLKASGNHTTVTAHVIRAVATALSEIEELKYRWEGEEIRYKAECDIAVAVDVGEGVIAPVIRGADQMDAVAIGQRLSELIEAAKSKSLKQSALGDASLTISNLGMFAIDRFYPIINLPEPLIVGIGRIRRSPCPDGDTIVLRNVITITQSIDHRVIDGAVAGRFAEKLQGIIEGTYQ